MKASQGPGGWLANVRGLAGTSPWRALGLVMAAATPWAVADSGRTAADCPPPETVTLQSLVNAARSAGGDCGSRGLRPAQPALDWNDTLAAVASQQARWLARIGALAHVGESGQRLGDRAHAGGYRWRRINENLAMGQAAAGEAVADWLRSDEHCSNLLDPGVAEFALVCAITARNQRVWVWVAGRR